MSERPDDESLVMGEVTTVPTTFDAKMDLIAKPFLSGGFLPAKRRDLPGQKIIYRMPERTFVFKGGDRHFSVTFLPGAFEGSTKGIEVFFGAFSKDALADQLKLPWGGVEFRQRLRTLLRLPNPPDVSSPKEIFAYVNECLKKSGFKLGAPVEETEMAFKLEAI